MSHRNHYTIEAHERAPESPGVHTHLLRQRVFVFLFFLFFTLRKPAILRGDRDNTVFHFARFLTGVTRPRERKREETGFTPKRNVQRSAMSRNQLKFSEQAQAAQRSSRKFPPPLCVRGLVDAQIRLSAASRSIEKKPREGQERKERKRTSFSSPPRYFYHVNLFNEYIRFYF